MPTPPQPTSPASAMPVAPEAYLSANAAGIARAAELLTQGHLVVVPTETVYGIALNLGRPQARETAARIRSRAADGAAVASWVVHVATVDDVLSWLPHVSALGRRLITKSLPGPVAFQVRLDAASEQAARLRLGVAADETIQQGFMTLRCPDCSVTQDILARVSAPVAIIGTGTASHPAAFELADLPPGLLTLGATGAVAAAVDGGGTRYRRPSTLVRLDGAQYSVVRQGVIDERLFQRMAPMTILFLCSGNTCRSPMAAALATRFLADKLKIQPADLPLRHMVVQSAGLHATRGMRATEEARVAVKDLGGDLSSHNSQSATTDLLRRADVIYTMTDAQKEEVLDLYPWAERKTFRLDQEGDIGDPIGASIAVYERVARRLANVLQNRLSELPL